MEINWCEIFGFIWDDIIAFEGADGDKDVYYKL